MGEGEFCVAVLSNGGMDNDKIPPKRDHQWLAGSSDDVEPLAKKHAKELLGDIELETCDGNRVNEDTDDVEREVCDGDRPCEAMDDITKPGTSVTNGAVNDSQAETCDSVMNAAPDDIEVEACAGDQASEAPLDGIIKLDASDVEPLAEKHAKELLDDIELETCDENRVNKDTDDVEQEVCDGDRPNEAPDDITKPGTSVTNGAPNASQAETCDSDMNAAPDDIELEACAGDHATEAPLDSIIKPDTSDTNGAPNDSQAETCNRKRNEAPSDIELEDCDGDLASGAPVDTIKPDTSDANEAPLDSQAETCNRGMNEAPDDIELEDCDWDLASEAPVDTVNPDTSDANEAPLDSQAETCNRGMNEAPDDIELEDRDRDLASEVPVDIIKPDTYDNNGVPNDSQAETCNRGMNEALGDVELEAYGGDQESEGQNDIIKPDTSDTNLDPNDSQAETCNRDRNGALNDIELEACCGDQVSEGTDHVEPETCHIIEPDTSYVNLNAQAETCNGDQSETMNDIELENCDGGQTNEGPNHIEPETLYGDQANETPLDIKTRTCEEVDDALNDIVPETCDENPLNEASNHIGPETFDGEQINEGSKNIELKSCAEQPANEYSNEMELEPSIKKLVKETSNDDICSEVSNPNLSPRGNASSFQTVSSLSAVELPRSNHGAFGEISSTCSRSDSGEASASEEEHGTDSTSDAISASHVVLEIPKHASTSGIRKITFKFSKRKEDYENQLSAIKPLTDDFDDGVFSAPRLTLSTPDDNYRQGWHETGRASTEVTVPGKNISDNYPTNVKKLLATRILDGARVKYISVSGDKELSGIVSNCGYLCGCSTCNFSKIVSAHEFEQHAGGKTRHPNNHIYLENGKPIYNIIQEIKTAPLGILDEVIRNVAGSSVNEEFLQLWKASLQTNLDMTKSEKSYHMKLMDVYHSRTSRITEDHYSPTSSYIKNIRSEPFTFKESPKERKRLVKKPKTYVSSTVAQKRSSEGGHKKRDNDLHRLLFMPNGLPDGTDLAYYARGQKILGGYKQGNGIVCSHCDTEISPSQFEAHAGWAAKRQPYRHIYTSSGLTLHDIALSLASGQSMETTNSDDMCAVCGDGGRLIFCDGCPRAFHAVCLGLESFPTEKWHCPYCRDNLGPGRKAVLDSRPLVIRLTRVVKAREYETGGCVVCRAHDFSVDKFDERTVMLCDQCEKEYHVGCLRDSGLCDLKALPSEKWFCSKDCNLIHGVMQDLVAKGSQVVSASVSNAINKKYREKGLPDIDPNDIRWRILSGRSRYHEHLPLLSRAAAIFRECFDPIIAASGRDLIPVMVYGRNISGQEFGGIFCVVLIVNSVVVSAGLLRIFGRRVAELPLVATSRQYQGKGYFQALFSSIEELLRSLNVENLVLPAAEEAESIWTKKLGFRRMSDERYFQYSRDNQLTIFKGTSMLEKELQHMAE